MTPVESFADFMQVVLAPLVGTGILVTLTGIWKHVKQTREDIERGTKLQASVDKLETATASLATQVERVESSLVLNGEGLPKVWTEHQQLHQEMGEEQETRWTWAQAWVRDHDVERGRTRAQLAEAIRRLDVIERMLQKNTATLKRLTSRPRRWWHSVTTMLASWMS